MARHTGGWVKFWRKAALGDINSNYTRGGLFGALIAMANIQESTVSWEGKPRTLKRGQIATSLHELADLGGVDVKTVSRHLAYLAQRETIQVEKGRTGTIITFANYEQYAGLNAEGPTPAPQHREDLLHTVGIHNEEAKKLRSKGTELYSVPKSKEAFLSSFHEGVLARYRALYPTEGYVEREALKAIQWCENNPRKNPKSVRGLQKFFTSWLDRGWERERQNIPTNPPKKGKVDL